MVRKILVSSLRNEGPYLLEWVAYHRSIGFDEIVLCYNQCDDGSEELLTALQDIGWLTAFRNDHEPELPPQSAAAKRFQTEGVLQNGDWVLWIDLDEFLNVHAGDRSVDALISHMRRARAMLLAWRVFGDGDGARFAGRFVDTRFNKAVVAKHETTCVTKTLFRYDDSVEKLTIHRPSYKMGQAPAYKQVILGDGRRLPANKRNNRWLVTQEEGNYPRLFSAECRWNLAQINHYVVRSAELFKLKAQRGRGMWGKGGPGTTPPRNVRHTPKFFRQMNRNDEVDNSILYWADIVTAKMTEALQHPAVRAAQDLVEQRLAEKLSEIAAPEARPGGDAVSDAT